MMVLTADRPAELHGCGALQTVEQEGFFGSHTRLAYPFQAPTADEAELSTWFAAAIARAMDACVGARPGPVHLNLPFREPLWDSSVDYTEMAADVSFPSMTRSLATLSESAAERLRAMVDDVSRVVIVAGPMHGPRHQDAKALRSEIVDVARARGWPIIAEPDSGLRFGPAVDDVVMSTADLFLREEDVCRALAPELVIRIGLTPTSKPVRHWLRDHARQAVILVDEFGSWQDPDHVARELVVADAQSFVNACLTRNESTRLEQQWLGLWRRAEQAARCELERLSDQEIWEGAAARALVRSLPRGALIHVANSMPIRDLDGFGEHRSEVLEVFSNRGANGIDGMLSTAAGEAVARGAPLVALSGDLSVLHDLSGLSVARDANACLTLAVMDNRGGGIFEHLPIAEHPSAFEKNFITPHDADIAELVRPMGVRAVSVERIEDFAAAIIDEVERPGLGVVVLRVDRNVNTTRHRMVWEQVGQRVRRELER
uniref:2-succinyl-6-hydroxy-2, 4-cyclohexadiene-1-carboxylate synthase n=1 Tax=uncultured myxobacterium HF0200_05J13 TaxID=723557 RepID=E7C3M2_9BACT|nr:2-succinyl-6-hydroxy-2,4-cyclohexadiene-1-carboxylate synthase [uncultured myxobacterium HF0200_05J13]